MIKASSWLAGLQDSGMTFSGAKPRFQGLGVVFSTADAKNNSKAVVSGIWNDGDRELAYGLGKDAPTADAKAIDFRNTLNAAQFRLRVTPTSIVGHLKQTASLSWNECFNIDRTKDAVKPGGYIGFTAWSGSSSPPLTTSDSIAITQFEVNNFDTTSIGEEMKDVSAEIQEAYREMLTDENRHFSDQKSQTDHLQRLTKMVQDHLAETAPADQKMFEDLERIQDKVKGLGENCNVLTKELQVVVGGAGSDLKSHIIGLRQLFSKDSTVHREKMDAVQKNVEEVKETRGASRKWSMFSKVAKQQETMQAEVKAQSGRSSFCLVAIIFLIGIIWFAMHSRMSFFERKNYHDASMPF